MIRIFRLVAGILCAVVLAACGGGGGSAGTVIGGSGGSAKPTLELALVDSAGNVVTGNSVPSGALVYARAIVKDKSGAAVPNKLVAFLSGSGLVTFQPSSGQVLTDNSGVARVQLTPDSITSAGAETLTANATVDTTNLSAAIDIQTTPASVTLANFAASLQTLSAFQSTSVSTDVLVNGVAALTNPVSVTFTSNCGVFSPATVTSNSNGKAIATFQASGCPGGPATLTASAIGASAVQTTIQIQAPQATTLLFVSATPSTIYSSVAAFGVKQSTVVFKVVDASGNAISAATNVQLSLSDSAIAAGVVFADTNSTTPKIVATDANGEVSAIVRSGAVPTPVSVNAQVVSNPAVSASSAGLTVNSGRPAQNFYSLSASVFNIEGWAYDGETTSINVRVADRLAQPIPAGTPITFIAEGGQIGASCLVSIDSAGQSGCSVTMSSQAFRPSNGRVTLLSYTDGEEAFLDTNGNNTFDSGETFYDMGQLFLDANENGTADATEQKIGSPGAGSGIGSASCPNHIHQLASASGTCDGAWGTTRVRGQAVIVFSTSFAQTTGAISQQTNTGATLVLADLNGNAMPFGTVVSAAVTKGVNCSLQEVIPATVANSTNPTIHRVIVKSGSEAGDTCTGAEVLIKATTPKGNVTPFPIQILP